MGAEMRRYAGSFVLFTVVAAAFLAGSWHGAHEGVIAAASRAEPRHVLYYTDGMHPQIRSETPGSCPICGMTLQPVYADAAAGAADAQGDEAIAVSPRQQQLIGVHVGAVEATAAADRIRLYGRVAADETNLYRVNVGADGYARELSSVTTGDRVTKDQWLATVSSPETRQPAQAFLVSVDVLEREMKSATRSDMQIDLARTGVDLAAEPLLGLGMAPGQLAEIRHTHAVPPTMKIAAPGDGVVLARNVSLGEKITRGTELYRIADLRAVWILADVPAADAVQIGPGTTATVTVPGRPTPIRARVSASALPQFDAQTQSVKVRFEADNPGLALRPDMSVDVAI